MIIQCQSCSGPIVRNVEISVSLQIGVDVSFEMKCPHCQKPQRVRFNNTGMQIFVNNKLIERTGDPDANIRTL